VANATIRVRPETRAKLQNLAEAMGKGIPEVVESAVDALERRQFLLGLASDFEALQNNPEAWSQELAERAEWDAAMPDQGAD
jgi:predicted transcriptional regulator